MSSFVLVTTSAIPGLSRQQRLRRYERHPDAGYRPGRS